MMKHEIVFCILVMIVFKSPIIYGQQNYRYENFGDKSTILNGNVTGSVSDLGAVYYNPSRLTSIKEPLFTVNGKIYQLNIVKLEDFISDANRLKESNFTSLPHMVAGTFKLKNADNQHFAYSLISKNRSDVSLSYNSGLEEDNVANQTTLTKVNIRNKITEEWFGASWAMNASENFSIGVSAFFSQYRLRAGNDLDYSTFSQDSTVALYRNKLDIEQESYGIIAKVGISYILPKFELGLNIDLPYWELYAEGSLNQEEFVSNFDEDDDRFTYNDFDDLSADRKVPLGIQLGIGFNLGKNKIHTSVGWNAARSAYNKLNIPPIKSLTHEDEQLFFQEKLRQVINYGAGLELYIAPKVNVYASYTTDFSPYSSNSSVLDLLNKQSEDVNFITNFHHFGFGFDLAVKRFSIVLGSIYSTGRSNFSRPVDFTVSTLNSDKANTRVIFRRWRFLVGFNYQIDKKKKKSSDE